MSVKLDFSICQSSNCKSITFTETTGTYDSTTNLTGWGALNELISDATEATLQVTIPGILGIVSIDLLSEGFPTDTCLSTNITSVTLGLGTTETPLPDGVYTFTYTVTTSTNIYYITKYVLLDCQVSCCVSQMLAKIPDTGCDCDNTVVKNALLAYTYLQALKHAGKCGNITKATNLLDILNKICNKKSCGCK